MNVAPVLRLRPMLCLGALVMVQGCGDGNGSQRAPVELNGGALTSYRWQIDTGGVTTFAPGADSLMFSESLSHVGWLSTGDFFVVDHALSRVLVVSPARDARVAFGGRGDGPNEFRNPTFVQLLPADTLVVWDPALRRLTMLHPPSGTMTAATIGPQVAYGALPVIAKVDKRLLLRSDIPTGSAPGAPPQTAILLTRIDGEKPDTICVLDGSRETPSGYRFFHAALNTVLVNKILYTGDGSAGVIIMRNLACQPLRVFSLSSVRREVTPHIIDSVRRIFSDRGIDSSLTQEDRFEKTIPAFGRMVVGSNGLIWLTSYAVPYTTPDSVTVYSPDGRLLGAQRLPPTFRLMEASDSALLGTVSDEDGIVSIAVIALRHRQ